MSRHRSRKTIPRRRSTALIALLAVLALELVGATNANAAAAVGRLSSFGANSYGELGNNSTTNASSPGPVLSLPLGATSFAAGTQHTPALIPDSSVVAWGRNGSGELGVNDESGPTGGSGRPTAWRPTPPARRGP